MQIEWTVCVFTGYTDLSGNRSRWLANISYLESRGLAACRATSRVSFIASMNWAPLTAERFKNKREQRQNNWSYFQEQKHNMRRGYSLHFFLSWSCEDLSPVVSFCFVRLCVTFSRSIWLQADSSIYSCEMSWLATSHHFKEPLGYVCLGRPLPPYVQPQTTNLIHASLVPLTAAILTGETWDKSVLGEEPRGALSANHSINRQQLEKPQSHEIMMPRLF